MGVDPDSELPVDFDPTDPEFLEAYLEELHHPLEDEGVDFWWLDWQQGGVTKIPGLDPLWLLNHFHFLDSGRDGTRPLTFSRYAGIGSHRYPIGFSGDTVITWESLDFQPYFTATASQRRLRLVEPRHRRPLQGLQGRRAGHPLGAARRVLADQPAALRRQPVQHQGAVALRRAGAERVMTDFLRLRHRLLPYLATMNLRAHPDGEPLVQPMYYDHPDEPATPTACPTSSCSAASCSSRRSRRPRTGRPAWARCARGCRRARWTDVFTGLAYRGGTTIQLHRDLDSIPVLAQAGAIVPLARPDLGTDELPTPSSCGCTPARTGSSRWPRSATTSGGRSPGSRCAATSCASTPSTASAASVPATRRYDVVLCGFTDVTGVEVDGTEQPTNPARQRAAREDRPTEVT